VEFDRYTVTLLVLRPDAPELEVGAANTLQDAHMSHLADLHEAGNLLAAGPFLGAADQPFRGLSIWRPDPDQVQHFMEQHPDPAVAAGRLRVEVIPWMVPSGAMRFARTRFPRSMAEAES
jgi:hypothetical protein